MRGLVFVIAGGEFQVPIIKKCQDNGYKVLNSNLYSQTRGALISDYFEQADIKDKKRNLDICLKYNPVAVLTDQSDLAVSTVAYVTHHTGLPGIGIECAERFSNKFAMREFASKVGIPCPKYSLVDDIDEALEFVKTVGFPVVFKPICSQGSRGVSIVRNSTEMNNAFFYAKEHSSDINKTLIEEFIDGREYSVEGFKDAERHYSLAVAEKDHFIENSVVASDIHYKPDFDDIDVEALKEQNDFLVHSMGLPFGITHAEYKFSKGKFYLIEIGARGGGANISSHVIPEVSGIDVNGMLLHYSTGQTPLLKDVLDSNRRQPHVLLTYFMFASGVIVSMPNEADILALNGVVDIKFNFSRGDRLDALRDDTSRHGHLILRGSSNEELFENLRSVKDGIRVEYQ